MASNGKREYLIQASDQDEAKDRAIEQATASNRLVRAKPLTVLPRGQDWFLVTMHVMEAAR